MRTKSGYKSKSVKAEAAAGERWAVCAACGDLNELGAAFWEAVGLAGCEEAPVRCGSCGAVYTLKIAGTPEAEAEPASWLAGENLNIENQEWDD
ncbi:MAG TPA: hypothetical protein PKW33_00705 [Anaerolineaceae bacterium]|nr:hypothetical protein [Anaerolineaceae bacterium]HPN50077.1 hypothetical protein [Anaerolineaceae bacterium]